MKGGKRERYLNQTKRVLKSKRDLTESLEYGISMEKVRENLWSWRLK